MLPRILIDISRLLYRRLHGRLPTGIDRVGLEYVRHYADRAQAVLSIWIFSSVLSRADSEKAFRLLLDPEAPATRAILWLVFKAYLRWWALRSHTDCVLFNISHTGLDNAGYASELRRRGARTAYFVHDLIPITHPQYCRPGERERHVTRMRTALATGRGLIVPSRHTLETLARFAGEAGLPLPPAVAAPLASGLPRVEPGPRPVAEPYFVVLGTIEPRKNHALLLQLWRSLVASYKLQVTSYKTQDTSYKSQVTGHKSQDTSYKTQDTSYKSQVTSHESQVTSYKTQDTHHSSLITRHSGKSEAIPRLVVIGRRGWECKEVAELLEPLRDYVIELNSCGDRELVTYLRHAQALLFPSFTEGYGLPLAEALALGTPAIAADLPVFREVAGDIPEYADPLDGRRWTELIKDYAGAGSGLRAAQIERMKGYRATTWEDHFKTVDEFIRQVTNS